MTRREMHEDQRRMQIDPQLRRKRESLSRRIAARRLANDAESADAVVTGRGGLGVALVYDATTDAPHVIARGRDWQGQRLRELAQDAGACVIEDAQLARRLYRACDAGDAVPEELHEEIAEVLAFARNLRKEPRT
jgi:flagellar biosynthetic protein FlhB